MKRLINASIVPLLAGVLALGMVSFAPSSANAKIKPATVDVQNRRCAYKKYQRVRVKWKGRWYKARIIKVRKRPYCRYKVHYIGYSKSWDQWVTAGKIRRR